MREMVFNDASSAILAPTAHHALDQLVSIAKGIASMIHANLAYPILRMRRPLYEIGISEGGTMWDGLLMLQRSRTEPDAVRLWMSLAQKVPLLVDLPAEITERFVSCEPAELSEEDGAPLVLCAHIGGITISLPNDPVWNVDELTIRFNEMLPDASIVEVSETFDNLAQLNHAENILSRYRRTSLDKLTPETFWKHRQLVFPALKFGLDVKDHVEKNGGNMFGTIMRRLADVNAAAADWNEKGGPAPSWTTNVTPESDRVMADPRLRDARMFRDAAGSRCLYEWHARFGGSGRIHLRFDATVRVVEIGYIGKHLPL